jgi:5-oxopent-3-ene-1,2,5-tricarboxylate decarboxylase / 2-hydroxyhepta-2,4-diene-1,7-dioate isomerase
MKIGYFSKSNSWFIGAVLEDQVIDLTAVAWQGEHPFFQRLTDLLSIEGFNPDLFLALLEASRERKEVWHQLDDVTIQPLYQPGKIICMGLNYTEHAFEAGREPPEDLVYFEKASSSVIAHGQPINCPSGIGRIDPEGELAVIIGKQAKAVDENEAVNCIAGYTILNDVTARDMQTNDVKNRLPWYRSKSLDTFCPLGPWIVTSDEIDPLEPLHIQVRVNREVRQDDNTGNLLFKIPSLIARISSLITLNAGDIISTGTPSGIAPIYPGDTVEVEIDKIGILKNPVSAKLSH